MYSSVAVTALTADELETLLGTSRRNNLRDDITGVLVHIVDLDGTRGAFVQVLEGDEAAVEATYARIEKDDLHSDLQVLTRGTAPGRDFADWSMRLEQLTRSDLGGAAALRELAAMERLVARYADSPAAG